MIGISSIRNLRNEQDECDSGPVDNGNAAD